MIETQRPTEKTDSFFYTTAWFLVVLVVQWGLLFITNKEDVRNQVAGIVTTIALVGIPFLVSATRPQARIGGVLAGWIVGAVVLIAFHVFLILLMGFGAIKG